MNILDKLRHFLNGDLYEREIERVREVNKLSLISAKRQSVALLSDEMCFRCTAIDDPASDECLLGKYQEVVSLRSGVSFGKVFEESLYPREYEDFVIVGHTTDNVYLFQNNESGEVREVDVLASEHPIHKFRSIHHALIYYAE